MEPDDGMGGLRPGWLAIELEAVEAEIEAWGDGLKESFRSALATRK